MKTFSLQYRSGFRGLTLGKLYTHEILMSSARIRKYGSACKQQLHTLPCCCMRMNVAMHVSIEEDSLPLLIFPVFSLCAIMYV